MLKTLSTCDIFKSISSNLNSKIVFYLQTESDVPLHVASDTFSFRKKIKEKLASNSTVFFRNGKDSVHNDAFEEIGDDDL